jgi:hypothetical protein
MSSSRPFLLSLADWTDLELQLCLTLLEGPSAGDPAAQEVSRLGHGRRRLLFPRRHGEV